MKRRVFLERTGLLLAGTAAAPVAHAAEPGAGPQAPWPVAITAPTSPLGRAVADALGASYTSRALPDPLYRSDDRRVAGLLRGVRAVIHTAETPPDTPAEALVDYRTRGTYDLLTAAAEEKVELVVYVSSLEIMAGHEDRYAVDETWRPVPTSAPEQLSYWLAEFTCREFAREGKLRAIVLRADEARDRAAEGARLALDAHFVRGGAGLAAWNVFHLAASAPPGRFPTSRAERILGYKPSPTM